MKLNHINLMVTDVSAAANFMETYFGLKTQVGNNGFTVMFDDEGLVLTLMKAPRSEEVRYPGTFHVGFIQGSEDQVNAMNERLKADGFDVKPPERHHAWTFYVTAPGGFVVEVLA